MPPPAPAIAAPAPPTAAPPVRPGNEIRIGVLLPLSGPSAGLGQAMLDAAQMALFEVGGERLQLVPRDTQGTPQGAAEAVKSALADGVRLIVGPLLAAEVEAVKPIAASAGVPVLAFSTQAQLAGNGVWLLGFLPRFEVERVIGYAHSKGLGRFAVLAPHDAYGEVTTQAATAAAEADGAALVKSDFFDSTGDLSPVVRRFAAGAKFDALLLPVGGERLRALAPLLPYYDIDPEKVKFLGTGLWDDPTIATEPELDGGWYAAPPPNLRSDFEQRFQTLYNHPPPRLATLGYDATALAAVLARGKEPDFSPAALTNPNGFTGLDGVFRLRADGFVDRGLAVIEVRRSGNIVVDPAPASFEGQASGT
jgi:branched-chain amino acid transport system substrate-binding protein